MVSYYRPIHSKTLKSRNEGEKSQKENLQFYDPSLTYKKALDSARLGGDCLPSYKRFNSIGR